MGKGKKLTPAQQRAFDELARGGLVERFAFGGNTRSSLEALMRAGLAESADIDLITGTIYPGWPFIRLTREAAESVGAKFVEWPRRVVRGGHSDATRDLRGAIGQAAEVIAAKMGCDLALAEDVAAAIFAAEVEGLSESEDDSPSNGNSAENSDL